jgi:hypothetical protein
MNRQLLASNVIPSAGWEAGVLEVAFVGGKFGRFVGVAAPRRDQAAAPGKGREDEDETKATRAPEPGL